ncbi:hypothetical protein AB835_00655 [Candidatus Endobugula sertula]|uniref:Phage tail protein n=1 Tax=Candidatus Endobugula sertula TaxID=62101 RepID=A0A1D2QTZ6_9GAMM|nr:hypothetical protein AB835_00655 [Candidatus Endobugula sertula]
MSVAPSLPPFAMVHTLDQWRRVAYDNTALEERGDQLAIVQLAWMTDELVHNETTKTCEHNGCAPARMAFDPWCRLYRVHPELGQVEKILQADDKNSEVFPLFTQKTRDIGQFSVADDEVRGPLDKPIDLLVDHRGHLFIAEHGRRRVLVYDVNENRLLRYIHFTQAPLKMATNGQQVWLLFDTKNSSTSDSGYAVFDARSEPRYYPFPEAIKAPGDIAVGEDIYLLDQAGTADAKIIALHSGDYFFEPYVQAMVLLPDNILVLARRAGEDFLRYQLGAGTQTELPHLKARHYDGEGIVVTPEGDVAYWSSKGFLHATLARVRYQTEGKITSFQLDSGEFQTQWGRLFIDACLPRGTKITATCLVLDEVADTTKAIQRSAPSNVIGMTIHRPDLSPPMPPQVLLENETRQQVFHRRQHGKEIPWEGCDDDEHFRTYEAPIIAPAGRYLWVLLTLTGTSRKTPRIKSLRAEYHDHDLMRRLPQVFSREQSEADFLRRYLAMPEGLLRDLDLKASFRHRLLDPYATPSELLPWLGSFIGLVVDHRWSESAKREFIANGAWLFRYRGTVMGIKRFVEIYLGSRVTIIEHFKVRGLGGALISSADGDAQASNAILGAGFRIGGRLGSEGSTSVNEVSIESAIDIHAHRFSLIIASSLTAEQVEVVAHLLDAHRPAHTTYDICTVDAGMRVGNGLYLGLTSIIGQTAGFGKLRVGTSILGHSDTIGRAHLGTIPGSSRLGDDSRVG